MKNKALTGILIVVVAFIWYKAFFRVKDGFFGEETEIVPPTRNKPISFASLSRDTFSIQLNYRDPFGETKKSYNASAPQETQQSARPDRISQQQASPLGRLILAFANTPLQYNRLIKKAASNLINRRGDWRSNVSRILYYGAAQNFIFSAMQQALFAVAFDDEDDEEILDTKTERIANGMLDSLLRGSGIAGAVISTLKNSIIEYMEQDKKGFKADYAEVLVEAINLSPPLGSKARKLYSAGKARKFNKDIMKSMNTFDYDNPMWEAVGNVTSALTNIPLDRLIRKTDNVREALNQDNTALQRTFLMLGWDAWSLRVGEKKIVNKGKENEYVKYLPLKQQAQEEAKEALKKSKKKNKGRFGGGRFN